MKKAKAAGPGYFTEQPTTLDKLPAIEPDALPGVQWLARVPGWLWLLIISAALRFVNLGGESVWYDESFTAWLAKLDFPHMLTAIQGDVHPPLWYLIEWLNVRVLGDSAFALRLPSALLSIVAVLLVWRLALACGFERRTAWLAGLLAAVLPASVYYAQDARMYPLLSVFVLLAALMAIRGNWIIFALASAGAIYSQNLGAFYIAALGLGIMIAGKFRIRKLIRPALAALGIGAMYLPWLPSLIQQAKQVGSGFWIQPLSLGGVLWPLASMTMGWRVPDALQLHVYALAIGLTLVGLIASRKWLITRPGLMVLAVALGAPVLTAIASVVWRSVYVNRAMLPATLALCLVWAYPLNHLSKPNKRIARAVAVPMLAIALLFHYYPAQGGRFPVATFAAPIREGWQAGDVVYHLAIDSYVLTHYYLPDLPCAMFPYSSDLNQSLTEQTKIAMGFNQVPFDNLADQGYQRAWLISVDSPLTARAQLDELARVEANYSWELIEARHDEQVLQQIILVRLQ
jgi:4-amino-4-deoxy-L-arabinose transferase-like glycosyltransferase